MEFMFFTKILCLSPKYYDFSKEQIELFLNTIDNKYLRNNSKLYFDDDMKFNCNDSLSGFNLSLYVTKKSISTVLNEISDTRIMIFLLDGEYFFSNDIVGNKTINFISLVSSFIQKNIDEKKSVSNDDSTLLDEKEIPNNNSILNAKNQILIEGDYLLFNNIEIKHGQNKNLYLKDFCYTAFRLKCKYVSFENCITYGIENNNINDIKSLHFHNCASVSLKKNQFYYSQISLENVAYAEIKKNLFDNSEIALRNSIVTTIANLVINKFNMDIFDCKCINIYNNVLSLFLTNPYTVIRIDYKSTVNFFDNTFKIKLQSESLYPSLLSLDRSSVAYIHHNHFSNIKYLARMNWNCKIKLQGNLFNSHLIEISEYDSKFTFLPDNKYYNFSEGMCYFSLKTCKFITPEASDNTNNLIPILFPFKSDNNKIKIINKLENIDKIYQFIAENKFDLEKLDIISLTNIRNNIDNFKKENKNYEDNNIYKLLRKDERNIIEDKIIEVLAMNDNLVCVLTTRNVHMPNKKVNLIC